MPKILTLFRTLKLKGFTETLAIIGNKLFSYRPKPIKSIQLYVPFFQSKNGIEIGGPSKIFSVEIPIYQVINELDGCNFSNNTVWEGTIVKGQNYNYFSDKIGTQYICEASNLKEIPSEKYDFLVASHCLEHCANALQTVQEWCRVIKKDGAILLILPDKRFTFDHNRPITKFNHLIDDYKNNIDESDLTHLEEILKLHDLSMDLPAGTVSEFEKRSIDNISNRCLHQHVFDFNLLENVFKHNNIEILDKSFAKPYHQIILGIKK